ncbi:MAG: TlpA family protein disulfide reductase [Bdellovibrionales bacterium]|nr:TlpA family protein disulfide reductase [Bdellovibrionales bacterium]
MALTVTVCGCHTGSEQDSSVLSGIPRAAEDLSSGEAAFDFELKTLGGETRRLSDFRGKVVLLNFWATWCSPCLEEMPALEELQSKFSTDEFVVVSIAVDAEKEIVESYVKEKQLKLVVLHDPTMKSIPKYKVDGFPESIFVDKEGKLLAVSDPISRETSVRILSDRPWANSDYAALVRQLINGGPA